MYEMFRIHNFLMRVNRIWLLMAMSVVYCNNLVKQSHYVGLASCTGLGALPPCLLAGAVVILVESVALHLQHWVAVPCRLETSINP